MQVKFKKLHAKAHKPEQAYDTDAGFDIRLVDSQVNYQDKKVTYNTGLAIEIPKGYAGLLFPRSSIHKTTTRLSNSVGVIDHGYTGEIKAVMDLRTMQDVGMPYLPGDRFLQLIIIKLNEIEFVEVDELSPSVRGDKGFGSSGQK